MAESYAIEEELLDREVGWFAYIKFYRSSDSTVAPLVIGKTGSKLVSPSGTDIQFRYDGDKPGRTFLREYGLEWDTTQVLVIPAASELEAYRLESEMARGHNLFFS